MATQIQCTSVCLKSSDAATEQQWASGMKQLDVKNDAMLDLLLHAVPRYSKLEPSQLYSMCTIVTDLSHSTCDSLACCVNSAMWQHQ